MLPTKLSAAFFSPLQSASKVPAKLKLPLKFLKPKLSCGFDCGFLFERIIMAISLISAPRPSDDNLVAKLNSSRSFSAQTKIETDKAPEAKATENANQNPQKTEAPKPSINTQGQVTGRMINTIA
jgi:hypothetical protein